LLIPFSLPATQGFFEIKPLPLNYWGMVVAVAGLVVVFIEIFKFIYRRLGHSHRIA
jgi:hypothetical protein